MDKIPLQEDSGFLHRQAAADWSAQAWGRWSILSPTPNHRVNSAVPAGTGWQAVATAQELTVGIALQEDMTRAASQTLWQMSQPGKWSGCDRGGEQKTEAVVRNQQVGWAAGRGCTLSQQVVEQMGELERSSRWAGQQVRHRRANAKQG